MNKFFVAAFSLSLFSFQGSVMANDLLSDVKEIRQNDKAANIDISETVGKYITVGQKKSEVEALLKAQKFEFSYVAPSNAAEGGQTLVADRAMKGLCGLGFHDEIRVIVTFEQDAVKGRSGKLIYRAI